MFKRISHRIALQFTAFVFVLFMINGVLFLLIDFGNTRRMSHDRLLNTADSVMEGVQYFLETGHEGKVFPQQVRENIRILGGSGEVVYGGSMFSDIEMPREFGFSELERDDEEFNIFTVPILRSGEKKGLVQIIHHERLPQKDLPLRALIYVCISIFVSGLTYFFGLLFARKSLQPAIEMMQKLEQFTQDASHELRTPISALNSSLDLALKTGEYKEGLLSAKDDVKEITLLIERLLELTRLEASISLEEKINISEVLTANIERYQGEATAKKIKIEANILPNIFVLGDASLVSRIGSNLLSNAIKFTDIGGTIRITLSKAYFSIHDTGIGMSQEDSEHIFDRFYQVDPSRSNDGYGLGLALVKRICQLHGWSIEVASLEGKGTTMTVRFKQNTYNTP